jgi:lysozyme
VALDLEDILPVVGRLDAVRQRVLIHMAFNMGVERLRTRLRFISAVQFRFWEAAALEMMFSDWAKPEQRRADVLAEMMRTGRDEPENVSECRSGQGPRR